MAELNELIRKIKVLNVHSKVTQRVLQSVHTDTDRRIFRDGIDVHSKLIGVYSKSYQKTRRRQGYPISRKVIIQATGQTVNDYKFLVLPDGNYGSGFSNSANFDKSVWVEKTYKTPIFELTRSEEKSISVRMDKELTRFLSRL